MDLSVLFRICSSAVLPGWLLLLAAPRWIWTRRVTTYFLPIPLVAVYAGLLAGQWNSTLSIASFDRVYAIFQDPGMVLVAWLHYLVLNLFAGGWEAQDAERRGVPHFLVAPCLLVTMAAGPVGVLVYILIRLAVSKRLKMAVESGPVWRLPSGPNSLD